MARKKTKKNNTRAIVRGRKTFCKVCKKSFTSKKKFCLHDSQHHFLRHCPNCPKTFRQTRKYILHLRSHTEDHPYDCEYCMTSFTFLKEMLLHKEEHKNETEITYLLCDRCPEAFPTIGARNRHRLLHSEPPYDCYHCGAVFNNIPDLTVHIKNHVFRCVMCPQKVIAFQTANDLIEHFYKVHRGKDRTDCDEPCISTGAVKLEDDGDSDSMDDLISLSGEESDSDVDVNYDEELVEPVYHLKRKDKFICFICYELYASPELLKAHMKFHNWFPCDLCPKFFANSYEYGHHKCNSEDLTETSEIETEVPESSLPDNYHDAATRKQLFNLIHFIKSSKEHNTSEHLIEAGYHAKNLKLIIGNPHARSLYMEEIHDLEELLTEFLELFNTLNYLYINNTKVM